MNDSRNAFYVGLVAVIGIAIGAAFFVVTRKSSLDDSNSTPYYALMTDAAGINAKSLIAISGLQVGEIQNVSLVSLSKEELEGHERKQLEAQHALAMERYNKKVANWMAKQKRRFPDKGEDDEIFDLPDSMVRDAPADLPEWEPARVVRVARVDFRVREDIKIPNDSWLKKESLGLLGANALFLEIGTPDQKLVEPGGRVVNVRSQTPLGGLQNEAAAIVENLKSITQKIDEDIGGITADIHSITSQVSDLPLDELYEMILTDIRKVTQTIDKAVRDVDKMLVSNDKAVSGLLANLDQITGDIAEMTGAGTGEAGEGAGEIRATLGDIRKITSDLSEITSTMNDVLGENEGEVKDAVAELKNTLTDLNRSLSSLAEVTERVENGEGTMGKLLTDEVMADKLERAISGASDYVATLTSLETHIDLGVWAPVRRGVSTVALGLKIQPRPDKFYLVEIVDDGGGLERVTQFFAADDGVRTIQREEDNQIRITAMFGKEFWDFLVLRAGLIETSGGVGADLLFFDDRIHLRSDIFNFGGPRNYISGDTGDPIVYPAPYLPRWRTMLKVQPIPHIYVMGGVDDVLNWQIDPANPLFNYGFDYFFGVGITFKDDDLRAVLPFVPSL